MAARQVDKHPSRIQLAGAARHGHEYLGYITNSAWQDGQGVNDAVCWIDYVSGNTSEKIELPPHAGLPNFGGSGPDFYDAFGNFKSGIWIFKVSPTQYVFRIP